MGELNMLLSRPGNEWRPLWPINSRAAFSASVRQLAATRQQQFQAYFELLLGHGDEGQARALMGEALREQTALLLGFDFVPARRARRQLGCGIDPDTGVMGPSGVVFLRRLAGSRKLVLNLRRLVDELVVGKAPESEHLVDHASGGASGVTSTAHSRPPSPRPPLPAGNCQKEHSMSVHAARILDEVRSAVHADPHLARRDLQFERRGRRITVRGTVESYYQKQLAQEALRRIDGVEEIENRLAVCWPSEVTPGLAQPL